MRNVKLLYIAKALYYTWFWLGIWVIYYKQFGGYAAVGLLETVMVFCTIIFEIPTGAIGDLLGKRKTLLWGYFFAGITQIWMGFAPNLTHIILSLVFMNFGGALISGTFEAMVYDSLKDEGKESEFGKVEGKLNAIRLISLAVAGVIGGYLAAINISMPYIVNGILVLCGIFVIFFTKEPKTDTEKFSLKRYIEQNKSGFIQIYGKGGNDLRKMLFLSAISVVMIILWEGANDMYMTALGFGSQMLGLLSAVFALAGAIAAMSYSRVEKFLGKSQGLFVLVGVIAITLVLSPVGGAIFGVVYLLVRNIISPLLDTKISVVLNEQIESKYRATALSTYSMIVQIPYLFLIYGVGVLSDTIPVSYVLMSLGVILMGLLFLSIGYWVKRKRNIQQVA